MVGGFCCLVEDGQSSANFQDDWDFWQFLSTLQNSWIGHKFVQNLHRVYDPESYGGMRLDVHDFRFRGWRDVKLAICNGLARLEYRPVIPARVLFSTKHRDHNRFRRRLCLHRSWKMLFCGADHWWWHSVLSRVWVHLEPDKDVI